jgi:small-conductance mechanosensitive channel
MEVFGIKLIGVNAANGQKLLLTIGAIFIVWLLQHLARRIARKVWRGRHHERTLFWTRQGINLATALILLLVLLSIWFDDPTRLATGVGLVTAGLAFALQKVVTSIAGYFVILRGNTFNVGDRITMGGVRGDVIALNFIQTTIMEMGQPPSIQSAEPAIWVKSRQYTGRVVTVTNDNIFQEPVYNYTRDFPYLWEEITIPITYTDKRDRAEQILLECAERYTVQIGEMSESALLAMQKRYFIKMTDLSPKVYYRITDNWLELTVRFVVKEHGIRDMKDAMSRDILTGFDEAGIGIASATYDIVGFPPIRVQNSQIKYQQ